MKLVRRAFPGLMLVVGVLLLAAAMLPQSGVVYASSTQGTGVNSDLKRVPALDDELEAEGVVASITSTRLTLEDGTSYAITADTEIDGVIRAGMAVEVEYEVRGSGFVALEIEAADEEGEEDADDDEDEDDEDEDEDEDDDEDEDRDEDDELEFEGVIASISRTELVLRNGMTFLINEDTEIEGNVSVGDEVDVEAVMLAVELEPAEGEDDEGEYQGVVASLTSSRLMFRDGTTFVINSDTVFDIDPRVGTEVEVDAVESNGSLIALDIDTVEDTDEEDGLKFEGAIASIAVTLEDGSTFVLNSDTVVKGFASVGARVDIDAVLLALEIEGEDEDDGDEDGDDEDDGDADDEDEGNDGGNITGFTSNGQITRLTDSSLTLNTGRSFRLTANTRMQGDVAVGAQVEVTFDISMGALVAKRVVVTQASASSNVDEIDLGTLQARVDNRFFSLPPLTLFVYEGVEDGEESRVEIRVLPDTMEIAGIDVTVALVEEYEGGSLTERTLDFHAQAPDGTAIYVGEYVDKIEDGVVISHGGQWIAGEDGALAGIFMPTNPKVGDVFEQERAKGFAEDISEVVAVGLRMSASQAPTGPYSDCIETKDTDPIDNVVESKFYCSGVGLVREDFEDGFIALARIGTFNASEIDQDVIDAIGQSEVAERSVDDGSLADFDVDQFRDEDGDLIMIGVVASVTDTHLVLTNGVEFAITARTLGANSARVGRQIEIEFIVSDGQLVALELD